MSRETRNFKKCVICNRRRTPGSNVRLTQLPLDPERCKKWIKVIGQEDLVYLPIEKLHQLKFMCLDHFKPEDLNQAGTRVMKQAVPSLKLPPTPLDDKLFVDFPLHIGKYSKSDTWQVSSCTMKIDIKSIISEQNAKTKENTSRSVWEVPPPATNLPKPPEPPEPKPAQSASTEEVDPLALDVKSEHGDSDTQPLYTEEPFNDETIKKHVTAVPHGVKPGDVNNTDVNTVAPVQGAPQTQAATSQPRVPSEYILHREYLKEIKNVNLPYMNLNPATASLSELLGLKLDNQKQLAQPAAQVQQNASTASLTILPPHDISKVQLLAELEVCKTEIIRLGKELYKQQIRNGLLEARLKKLRSTRNDKKAMLEKLTVNMSAPAKAFFQMQFQIKKKQRGRRYSLPGRIVALSIYKASPACYALLSKYFVLPSKNLLKRFIASITKPTAAADTTVAKETEPNKPENVENQDIMLLDDEHKMNGIKDLGVNDNNINDTFQQEIDENSEAVDRIVYETQGVNNEPQSSQVAEDLHQMIDDTSEVQTVELCEGQALQLADGRIFQLIDGQIVEVIGELQPEELNLPCDEVRGTGSIALPSETPLPQDNVSSRRQTIVDYYQRSHRDTSLHSMTNKPNSFDGRPAKVDELSISYPQKSQVGEQATQIKHPHRTQQQHTKHQQTTKETSSFTDSSRTVTRPVISLKRVATDKEPITSTTSATQLNRIQQCYRKILKTKITSSRGPDMPDLTFS